MLHRGISTNFENRTRKLLNVSDCRISETGAEYAGVLSTTSTGRSCLRWDSLSQHATKLQDANRFPDASLYDTSSYCRNPDRNSGGPWCYWGDNESSWEHCSIPSCTGIGYQHQHCSMYYLVQYINSNSAYIVL